MSKLKPKQVQERNIKSRVKINEIKNRKTIEKLTQPKIGLERLAILTKIK